MQLGGLGLSRAELWETMVSVGSSPQVERLDRATFHSPCSRVVWMGQGASKQKELCPSRQRCLRPNCYSALEA